MLDTAEINVNKTVGGRRSDLTKQKILQAAEEEFAEKGLYGTRVDEIATRAGVNKRMMYVYFGNKEDLYSMILKIVYSRLSEYEQSIKGINAIEILILKYFNFLAENPNFVKLTLWENLNDAKYFKSSGAAEAVKSMIATFADVLSEKKKDGIIGEETDCMRLAETMNAMCLSAYSDMYNMSCLLEKDLTTEAEIKKQAEYICRIITAYVK